MSRFSRVITYIVFPVMLSNIYQISDTNKNLRIALRNTTRLSNDIDSLTSKFREEITHLKHEIDILKSSTR